jgi:hypothetical protein
VLNPEQMHAREGKGGGQVNGHQQEKELSRAHMCSSSPATDSVHYISNVQYWAGPVAGVFLAHFKTCGGRRSVRCIHVRGQGISEEPWIPVKDWTSYGSDMCWISFCAASAQDGDAVFPFRSFVMDVRIVWCEERCIAVVK